MEKINQADERHTDEMRLKEAMRNCMGTYWRFGCLQRCSAGATLRFLGRVATTGRVSWEGTDRAIAGCGRMHRGRNSICTTTIYLVTLHLGNAD